MRMDASERRSLYTSKEASSPGFVNTRQNPVRESGVPVRRREGPRIDDGKPGLDVGLAEGRTSRHSSDTTHFEY